MSLLPSKFQPEQLPSLGALVREAIAPKVDPIKAFETGDHAALLGFYQIGDNLLSPQEKDEFFAWQANKGAAQGGDAFLAPVIDCLKRLEGEYAPPSRSVPEAAQPKFRVGDRVRPSDDYRDATWKEAVVTRVTCDGAMVWAHYSSSDRETWIGPRWIELLPSSTAQDSGWIEWKGGKCPITDGVRWEYKTDCSPEPLKATSPVDDYEWAHKEGLIERHWIRAYRVLP